MVKNFIVIFFWPFLEVFFALETVFKPSLFVYQNCMMQKTFGVIYAILGNQILDSVGAQRTRSWFDPWRDAVLYNNKQV